MPLSVRYRVVRRHERVSLTFRTHMAHAGEGQMSRSDPFAVGCGFAEDSLPLSQRGGVVAIELDRYRRVGELHRGHVQQIADEQHALPAALDQVAAVTRCVTM